ncbi:MAG: helix-turn-helix domain-containing protein [Muricomes sp.]
MTKILSLWLVFCLIHDIIKGVLVTAKRRDGSMQDEYLGRMVKNLSVLRASVDLTQKQLGEKLGVSRQTIVAIENGKSPLTWSLYLAIVLVFQQFEESKELLEKLELFSTRIIRGCK